MASSYEAAAKESGEIRLYLSTQDHLDLERLKELMGYRYALIREHHCAEDSWSGCSPILTEFILNWIFRLNVGGCSGFV
jgi:hypothetical protein